MQDQDGQNNNILVICQWPICCVQACVCNTIDIYLCERLSNPMCTGQSQAFVLISGTLAVYMTNMITLTFNFVET